MHIYIGMGSILKPLSSLSGDYFYFRILGRHIWDLRHNSLLIHSAWNTNSFKNSQSYVDVYHFKTQSQHLVIFTHNISLQQQKLWDNVMAHWSEVYTCQNRNEIWEFLITYSIGTNFRDEREKWYTFSINPSRPNSLQCSRLEIRRPANFT